ncbi:hypothetical protein BS17DRAFT_768128 [Gyrodon lividus]|nr:hypothetical protein BS17DRAFT_768128 [Gyrodon lividus]
MTTPATSAPNSRKCASSDHLAILNSDLETDHAGDDKGPNNSIKNNQGCLGTLLPSSCATSCIEVDNEDDSLPANGHTSHQPTAPTSVLEEEMQAGRNSSIGGVPPMVQDQSIQGRQLAAMAVNAQQATLDDTMAAEPTATEELGWILDLSDHLDVEL